MFLAHFLQRMCCAKKRLELKLVLPLGFLDIKINKNKADSFFRLHFNVYVHRHWPFSHWRRIVHLFPSNLAEKLHVWIKQGGLSILN